MLMSDIHMGGYPNQAHQSYKARDDLNRMTRRLTVDAWLLAGDQTNDATPAQQAELDTWLAGLNRNGAPLAMVPGNHDLIASGAGGGVPDVQTPTQWAANNAQHGVTGKHYVVDVPDSDLRILCVSPMDSPVGSPPPNRLSVDDAVLDWCDARLSETTRRCIILHHAPLPDTVLAKPGVPYTSVSSSTWRVFSLGSRTAADMCAGHPNLIAWVSGHLHSHYDAPDIVKRNVTPSGAYATVALGSPLVLPIGYATPGITSAMMTVYGDRVEVRYRDHGAGQWLNPWYTVTL
ncbi:metallophosphoesterase [Cellulomonas sp. ACRRI]|uniref:metallophosphoesterase family protein n=1 Tax=Cellulomonas sp. ACRRI TaxID=2918188 RepID=UPI001EF1DBD5|nr:metallophosphoesterase [Cellulomonas sp. ACRRI]MCG7285342.1 metallophosphoesterase [Cellulomonas sp. ACRRI]